MELVCCIAVTTLVMLFLNSTIIRKRAIWYFISLAASFATAFFEIFKILYKVHIGGVLAVFEKVCIKGFIAISLFLLVMFAGALNNKLAVTKKLVAIRAQMAIMASIFIFPHVCIYLYYVLKYTFPEVIDRGSIELFTAAYILAGIIAFIIMMPLFITSLKKIRRKMNGVKWKKLQRWAYLFYLLVYGHILFVMLNSKKIDLTRFVTYNILFGIYFILRVTKTRLSSVTKSVEPIA
ncbi:membrane protein [Clostridium acetobutylicum]|nr:membrane protein [Clostridium acetobutylicum]